MNHLPHRRIAALLAVFTLAAGASPAMAASRAKRTTTTTRKTTTTKPVATTTTTTVAPATTTTTAPLSGSITVFGAASLTASFTDIAAAFQKAHPTTKVVVSFAGSSTLVTQIQNGAPADVFASADTANMEKLVNAKLVDGAPSTFTRNKPMIVVPKGNPLRVKSLADLGRPEVVVALGAVGVPVGDYARQILAKAGVTVTPKTLESSVSAIVNKAALREIDAGIVYVTDVAIDDYRVDGVAIPDEQNVIATYPAAVVQGSGNRAVAQAFVSYLRTPAAQAILAKYKFLPLA